MLGWLKKSSRGRGIGLNFMSNTKVCDNYYNNDEYDDDGIDDDDKKRSLHFILYHRD
jgi:hypothetical protein